MKIDNDLSELIGIHIGDGCISVNRRYQEYYLGGDLKEEKDYHDKWVSELFNKKVMLPLCNKRVRYKSYPKLGIYGFYIFDKRVVDFFRSLGIKAGSKINVSIPKKIRGDSSLSKRFLRGLFDTDGNIYFDKNRSAKIKMNNQPTIKLGTVSNKLINQVFEMLINLGFHPRFKKPYKGRKDKNEVYTILIYRRSDIKRFIEEIGFKNLKHYTKWLTYNKFGYCPPHTTLKERLRMLKQKSL